MPGLNRQTCTVATQTGPSDRDTVLIQMRKTNNPRQQRNKILIAVINWLLKHNQTIYVRRQMEEEKMKLIFHTN